eukprot:scaffold1853_cov367-Prasinococcus_capsulatus_cf.AAC.7
MGDHGGYAGVAAALLRYRGAVPRDGVTATDVQRGEGRRIHGLNGQLPNLDAHGASGVSPA